MASLADYYSQAPSILTAGGGRVTAYQDDPSIAGYTPAPKTDRGGKTTTSFAKSPEGISLAALFGSGPTVGPYVAAPRSSSAPKPAQVVQNGYDSGYVKTNVAQLPAGSLPAIAAIEAVAPTKRNRYDTAYVATPKFGTSSLGAMYGSADPGDGGMFGIPMSPGMAEILATDPKYRAPAGAAPTRWAAPAPAPAPAAAAPKGLLSTLADMFAPAASAGPTYTTTPFQQQNFQTTEGAGMPHSMSSERWTTGYGSTTPGSGNTSSSSSSRWW